MGQPSEVTLKPSFDTVGLVFTIICGIGAFIFLFPSISNWYIFRKGDFIFLEAIGVILTMLTIFGVTLVLFYEKLKIGFGKYGWIVNIVVGTFGIALLILTTIFVWIRVEVKSNCQEAIKAYRGDCVESLLILINDEHRSFFDKNKAIFTLGQLADQRSLPFLRRLFTGKIPDREPLDEVISQYELKKTIEWIESGNVTSWMYWDE